MPQLAVHPHMNAIAASMTDHTSRAPVGLADRCPYCQSGVELVTGMDVYPDREELADRHIWRCTACDAHVGCHKPGARVVLRGGQVVISDGTLAMGTLADHNLRAARVETHRMFDSLWAPPACMSRHDAYAWMAKLLAIPHEEAHIASLTYDEAIKVQLAIEDLLRPPGEKPDLPGAAHWLQRAGIEFTVEADGRLAVKAGEEVIDYSLDRDVWEIRGQLLGEREGPHDLIMYCRTRG